MNHDRIVCAIIIGLVPDCLIETLGRENLPAVPDQNQEYFKLGIGQLNFSAVFCDSPPSLINPVFMEGKDGKDLRSRRGRFFFSLVYLIAANQRPGPADQFVIGKGFCQIVVTAAGKSQGFIAFPGPGT